MSPEIRRNQLTTTDRVEVQEILEAQGLEFATDAGDVDVFVNTDGDPIIVVPQIEDIDAVDRVFYLESAEKDIRPLIKDGVIIHDSLPQQAIIFNPPWEYS